MGRFGSNSSASLVRSTSSAWKLHVRQTSGVPVICRASAARTLSTLAAVSVAIFSVLNACLPFLEIRVSRRLSANDAQQLQPDQDHLYPARVAVSLHEQSEWGLPVESQRER